MANDEAKEGVIFAVENNRILFSDSSTSIPTQGKNRHCICFSVLAPYV